MSTALIVAGNTIGGPDAWGGGGVSFFNTLRCQVVTLHFLWHFFPHSHSECFSAVIFFFFFFEWTLEYHTTNDAIPQN